MPTVSKERKSSAKSTKPKTQTQPTPSPLPLSDLFQAVEYPMGKYISQKTGKQMMLFHPNDPGVNFAEIQQDMAKAALEEIVKKLPAVQVGMDQFTECEKLMFIFFMNNAKNWEIR
jgi:hypothetical protein